MGIYKRISTKSGFDAVIAERGFKCAYITHAAAYSFGAVTEMKRHNETEEVFVLLTGEAVMLTLEDGVFTETPLVRGEALVVAKGTYHYLGVTADASVFVVERDDTCKDNTDALALCEPYVLEERK